jgi:hypothetical protein
MFSFIINSAIIFNFHDLILLPFKKALPADDSFKIPWNARPDPETALHLPEGAKYTRWSWFFPATSCPDGVNGNV